MSNRLHHGSNGVHNGSNRLHHGFHKGILDHCHKRNQGHHGFHIGILDHWHKWNQEHNGFHIGTLDHRHKRNLGHKNVRNPYGNVYKRRMSISCPSTPTGIRFEPGFETRLLLERVAEILCENEAVKEGSSSPCDSSLHKSNGEISEEAKAGKPDSGYNIMAFKSWAILPNVGTQHFLFVMRHQNGLRG